MKALSIKQPWAWLIIHGGKDIENRTWDTKFRGRFFVHASLNFDEKAYERFKGMLPPKTELRRGGIIGSVELISVIKPEVSTDSQWYQRDHHGFALREPRSCAFVPYRGRLNFFEVPFEEVI